MNGQGNRLILGIALAGLGIVVALPVLFVLLQAVFPRFSEGSFGTPFAGISAILGDLRILGLLGNSLGLGLAVCAGCLILALPLAALRGSGQAPGGPFWDLLFVIPFMLPSYIGAFAWQLALEPHGFAYQLFGFDLGGFLFSFWGIAAVMTLHLFPVVYFALSHTLAVVGARFASAARICGAGPLTAFVKITLPLSLPGLAASLLLVFALAIEEFGTPATLGAQSQFLVLVTAIEEKFAEYPIDPAGAATLSLILVAMALLAFWLQNFIVTRRSYVAVSGKHGQAEIAEGGRWRWLAPCLFGLVAVISVLIPVASVTLTAFSRTLSGGLVWGNLGLLHFRAIFANAGGALDALLTSLWLAAAASVGAGVLGTLTAYVTARTTMRGRGMADALSILPNALPGIVIAVGMILAWNRGWWPLPVYNTPAILLLAYICLLLPYPVRYVSAGLRQIGPSLDAAARVGGAGPWMVLRRILLPLIAPHLMAAMLLVFAIASRELVASVMLAPSGMKTVATYVFNQFAQGSPGAGMALAVIAVFGSTAILVALNQIYRKYGAERV